MSIGQWNPRDHKQPAVDKEDCWAMWTVRLAPKKPMVTKYFTHFHRGQRLYKLEKTHHVWFGPQYTLWTVANIEEQENVTENSRWPAFLKEFEDLATLGLCSCLATIDWPLPWSESALQSAPLLLPAWLLEEFVGTILQYGFKTQQTMS